MAVAELSIERQPPSFGKQQVVLAMLGLALVLSLAQWTGILPEYLHRLIVPEWLGLEGRLDRGFEWIRTEMFGQLPYTLGIAAEERSYGLVDITRAITDFLEFILRASAHLLFGKKVLGFISGYWVVALVLFAPLAFLLEGRRAGGIVAGVILLCTVISYATETASTATFWSLGLMSGIAAIGMAVVWKNWVPLATWGLLFLLAAMVQGYEIGPLPWTALTAVAGVVGWVLGGWRLAALAAGTFTWTALIGQWEIAMETLSVLIVAAPVAFLIGLLLGIAAWKFRTFDMAIKPILAVLQTLPFFTYLLPAVIFFKVGATAGAVATIIYAIPPMILMTTLGLKKVSPEIIEAGQMSGCTRWQMLTRVYIPSARTEILVGVNQVIMLCLAMVVITAFIGMPGLGAKLLAMMGSFKIGRSFEIGITIVLIAVMLDRLTKAWVAKQPEHFAQGTAWWRQNIALLVGLGAFVFCLIAAWVSANYIEDVELMMNAEEGFNGFGWMGSILDEVGSRRPTQHLSQGRELDSFIKDDVLQQPWLKATTEAIRGFMNNWVLVPFRDFLLSIPAPAFILIIVVFAYGLGGLLPAICALGFFIWVAMSGWWDRSVITIYYTLSATLVACLVGLPIGIWAGSAGRSGVNWQNPFSLSFVFDILSLIIRRIPIAIGAVLTAAVLTYIARAGAWITDPSTERWVFWAIFAVSFYLYWRWMGRMDRDKFLLLVSDSAQTFPSFVYLIPAIMLFGITDVSVIFAITIFATVPLIRYTIEGLSNVPSEIVEAAEMSGATRMQKLFKVQLPLALPTMAVGFNQSLMFAFFMTMIAAFIGTIDLGQELQRTLAGTDLGKNFVLGLNVAFMALTFDLTLNRWSDRRKAALGL